MKKILNLTLGAFFITALFSCGANKDNESATQTMDAFYKALQSGNMDEALNNCAPEAFGTETKDEWKALLEKNIGLLGNIKSFTKTSGWNINKSTETGTSITMKYDVVYEFGKSTDSITLIKSDDVMKILNYNWDFKEAMYLKNIEESEKLVMQYMDALSKKDFNTAFSYCGYNAVEITPEAAWVGMLASTSTATGDVVNYELVAEKSHCTIAAEGGAGKGNYYDIEVASQWQNGKLDEIFICFQPTYTEPLKIISHQRQ